MDIRNIMTDIERQIQSVNEQQEQLNHLKENYTVQSLIEAQENNEIDVETMFVPTSFKRLSFMGAKHYKVNASDFYGNIVIETEQPRLLSAISLMTIHTLMTKNYDRYGVILAIKQICERSSSTSSVIKGVANIIPQVETEEARSE